MDLKELVTFFPVPIFPHSNHPGMEVKLRKVDWPKETYRASTEEWQFNLGLSDPTMILLKL